MSQRKLSYTISAHFIVFALSIILTALSDQNPRVLLYAQVFSVLFRITTVWLIAVGIKSSGINEWMVRHCTRTPRPWEISRPHKNSRTGKPAGIVPYVTAILTLLVMLGVMQMMGSGPGFLKKDVLIPEVVLAVVIATGYWINDLYSKKIIISSNESVPYNLGYNTGDMGFLMAAIFIGGFTLPFVIIITSWALHGKTTGIVFISEWVIFITLMLIRFVSDVLIERKKEKGSFRKMSRRYK